MGPRGGAREPRVHLHEPRSCALCPARATERDKRLQRRPPRFEEGRTERHHQTGAVQIVAWSPRDSVHQAHDRLGAVTMRVTHVVRRSVRLKELPPHIFHRTGAVPGNQSQCLRPPSRAEGLKPLGNEIDGLLAGQRTPLVRASLAHSQQRRTNPLRMVEELHSRDAAGTHASATHGMQRIPRDPYEAPVHHAPSNAAMRRTEQAGGVQALFDARRPAPVSDRSAVHSNSSPSRSHHTAAAALPAVHRNSRRVGLICPRSR
jgi:hypothetical protein